MAAISSYLFANEQQQTSVTAAGRKVDIKNFEEYASAAITLTCWLGMFLCTCSEYSWILVVVEEGNGFPYKN